MKRFSLLLILLLTTMVSVAQNDCQEIIHSITSSTHTPLIEVDPTNGDTIIYYDLCLGEELTLVAEAVFPENNTTYNQTIESTQFTWFVNETQIITANQYTNTYNTSEGFIVSIISFLC